MIQAQMVSDPTELMELARGCLAAADQAIVRLLADSTPSLPDKADIGTIEPSLETCKSLVSLALSVRERNRYRTPWSDRPTTSCTVRR